ncbi:hypothetical protein EPO17_03665 [Patescibacteria group bacterium]|nr:MAG: hypothetical protein EPO17_03665 [Patescibacteria group bacterium]
MNENTVIVIQPHGWVVVGVLEDFREDGITLSHTATIRRWGTTNGIGELRNGPKKDTVVDFEGRTEIPTCNVLRRIEVSGWIQVLRNLDK